VVREYIGTGEVALEVAELDAIEREQRQREKATFKVEKEAQSEIDLRIEEESKHISTLTDAILLVNGYHKHKGQWRKKRNG